MNTEPQRPRLQIAIDLPDRAQSMDLIQRLYPAFDIVEIGTPLIFEAGLAMVTQVKERFPDKQCLADMKIMDAGYLEASCGFRHGADFITVMGLADNLTVQGAVRAAREAGRWIMADLMHVQRPVDRALELFELGVTHICVHTAYDVQSAGNSPLTTFGALRQTLECRLAIAGGINASTIGPAIASGADIIVVGAHVTTHPDPRAAAERLMAILQGRS